jgi:tRNA threonylcarbamoyladenosine biosynthesis protein TsaB
MAATRLPFGLRSYSVLILALDTTTRDGSVAVCRDASVMAVVPGDGTRTHGERLPGEIARALDEAGVAIGDLDLLAVASGPGAFTGLRIGLASIQGLAMVLDVSVVGVSALDALAYAASRAVAVTPGTQLNVWMDAQRGEVFGAQYQPSADVADAMTPFTWRPRGEPIVSVPFVALAQLDSLTPARMIFAGDGAVKYRSDIAAWSSGQSLIVAVPPNLAPAIAAIGLRLAAQGHAGPPHALQPLYVRRPDAELERLRRSEP